MSIDRLTVLKFGGSVLTDLASLERAADEVRRWVDADHKVLAVVSSLSGRTDELSRICDDMRIDRGSSARAAYLGTGEMECAALFNLVLVSRGIVSTCLSPAGAALVAEGPHTDAYPAYIHEEPILHTLERSEVLVYPGYVANLREGDAAVLGRGGSDLSALFLAAELGAHRCRLIKDVDGLYEFDPARRHGKSSDTPPRRYLQASYADALATDGSIVQHKAVRFARDRGQHFELGGLGSENCTLVGNLPTLFGGRFELSPHAAPSPPEVLASRSDAELTGWVEDVGGRWAEA